MKSSRRVFIGGTGAALAITTARLPLSANAMSQPSVMMARPIPATGEMLPVVGLGNSPAFRNNDLELAKALLNVLLQKGGSFVDTGGAAQRPIGLYMNEHGVHERLFLGTNMAAGDKHAGLQYIKQAQGIQGKEPLDLLQVHRLEGLKKQWKNLREWKDAGLARYIGVATTRREAYPDLEALMKTGTMDFLQINYSLLETASAERLLPVARDMGVAIVTNRPFVNGKYFPLVKDRELPEWAAEFDCQSWAQFSLKFILAHPAVNCVLTETTKPRHAHDNLSAGFGRLPNADMQKRMLELVREWS